MAKQQSDTILTAVISELTHRAALYVYTDDVKGHDSSILNFQQIEFKLRFKSNVDLYIKIFCRIRFSRIFQCDVAMVAILLRKLILNWFKGVPY